MLAEFALWAANFNDLFDDICKAQLYRGQCLLELGLYADASFCFTRAASPYSFSWKVAEWKTKAEKLKSRLPMNDPRRKVSPDLKVVPEADLLRKKTGLSDCWAEWDRKLDELAE
jgi:hypothetical protein